MKKQRWTELNPARIAILYAIIGGMWIFFSDRLTMFFVKDSALLTRIQTYKGWLYVIVTAGIIYLLVKRYLIEIQSKKDILEKIEQYNRMLFELSPIGLALCRMDGSLVDVNEAYAKIIERTVEETLTLTYWDITPKEYAQQEQQQIESLRTTSRYGPYEKEYIHKDGHRVPVRLQGQIIEQHGEKFIWSSVEDITEQKKAEEGLRLSEEKFAKAFRNSPDTIILTDIADGRIVEVNEAFSRRTGFNRDEAVGRTTLELNLWMDENDRNRFISLLMEEGRVTDL